MYTLLNMLSEFIPNDELIITIEDVCELQLRQKNVRRMEVRVSNNKEMMKIDQQTLVKAALRQRPDRIILGESRDGSIVDLISAMSTGHDGSLINTFSNPNATKKSTSLAGLNSERIQTTDIQDFENSDDTADNQNIKDQVASTDDGIMDESPGGHESAAQKAKETVSDKSAEERSVSRNCEHYSESDRGWKTVIKNCWERYKRIIENYSTKEVSIEAFFCFTRKQTFY